MPGYERWDVPEFHCLNLPICAHPSASAKAARGYVYDNVNLFTVCYWQAARLDCPCDKGNGAMPTRGAKTVLVKEYDAEITV